MKESKQSFRINVILNTIKQICTLVFPLITFPYVTRMLGKEAYGAYSYSFSIVSYFSILATFGVNTYAIREGAKLRNRKQIGSFCNQVYTINGITSLVSLELLLLLTICNSKINDYRFLILLESFSIILAFLGKDWINSIYEDYLYLTIRYIILQIIGLICIFIFVRSEADIYKYVLIYVLTTAGGNIPNIFHVKKYVKVHMVKHMGLTKHIIPMTVLFANNVATLIYVNVDVTMLGHYYSDSIVGIYSFSSKIYSVIKSLINAVIVVALPRLSFVREQNKQDYEGYLNEIFNVLITIMLPAVTGVFVLSKQIILLMGGASYIEGDTVLRILCFAIFFAMLGSFFVSCVLIICNKEKCVLHATSAAAITNILLNFYFIPTYSINGAAITTLVAEIIACVLEMKYAMKEVEIKKFINLKEIIGCIVGSLLLGIYCLFVLEYISGLINQLLLAIIPSIAIYIFISVLFGNRIAIKLKESLKKYLRMERN